MITTGTMMTYLGDNGSCDARIDHPEPFSIAESIFLALTLGTLIMAMIIGNILVIMAIVLERELQRAQYYLILSLAVADLTVGVLVSPLAALYDINRQWHLGVPMCDFWIASDVLACTSSILHLLAIALDRYWSITDVSYIQKRTPRRVCIMILVIWIVSFSVSVAPILGWKDTQFTCRVEVRRECLISQAIGYQIFSTATAFYGPLVLICILYWKIYKAAKQRIQMQVKRRSSTVSQLRAKILAIQQNQEGGDRRRSTFRKRKQEESSASSHPTANGRTQDTKRSSVQIRVTRPSSNEPTVICGDTGLRNGQLTVCGASSSASSCYSFNDEYSSYYEDLSTGSVFNPETASAGGRHAVALPAITIASPRSSPDESLSSDLKMVTDEDTGLPSDSPTPSQMVHKERRDSLKVTRARAHSVISTPCEPPSSVRRGMHGARLATYCQADFASSSVSGATNGQRSRRESTVAAPALVQKKRRFRKKESAESSRERRAGRTLAIITGIFVVCWVPFFVLALVRPLCGGENCPIPEPLNSVFLWLGYVNSAVNPVIYTIFSPDFRMAFKKTLQRFCFFKRL